MALQIIEKVLPIFVLLALGYAANRWQWFDAAGMRGMKALVGNVLLPVVLFNAFLTADYSGRTVLCIAVVYGVMALALLAGYGFRRFVPGYTKYMPFLVSSFEGGMLGYALFGLIYGSANTALFATIDGGQTFFAHTLFVTLIKITSGNKPNPSAVVRSMFENPCFDAMILGVILGATGIGGAVFASAAGGIVSGVISSITAPTSALILLSIGYEFSLKKKLLMPVFKTAFLRLAVMGLACAACAVIVFALTPFDKPLLVAMMVGFSLPAAFIVPIYAKDASQADYISTTLSVETLFCLVCFVCITAFAMM